LIVGAAPVAKRTQKQIEATAIHEAGHAVLARVLTLAAGGATIKIDFDSAGHSVTHDPYVALYEWEKRGKARGPEAVWHARIIAFMAGAEAECELLGSAQPGDGDDRYQIELMAEQLCSDEKSWERLERRLRAMTQMLVRRHRTRIDCVANALIVKKTLDGEELDRLVGRSVADVRVNAPLLLELYRSNL
jgi:hypothetical protein